MKQDKTKQLHIDPKGRYKSDSLPRLAGHRIELPAQIDERGGYDKWQQRISNSDEIIALDLFCGAGGLSLGFEDAGFFVAAGIDKDMSSVMTHGYNFLSKGIEADISAIEDPHLFVKEFGLPRVDIIVGGPPCQGFSRVGRGKLRSVDLEEYYTTVMNELYREFMRFVAELRPLAFVMENVPDMALFNNGELVQKIIASFELLGYKTTATILDAVNYGVPQRRKRLFIQGNRIGILNRWPAPRLTDDEIVTVREAIGDLPARMPPSTDEILPYLTSKPTAYQRKMRERLPVDQQNVVFDHIIRGVREDDQIIFAMMNEGDKYDAIPEEYRRYRSDIFKDKYSKLYWDRPSWTITAHIRKDAYRYIHPDSQQGRMLSVREFARIQSFPDHFRFCGAPTRRMQQIGNAVPPLLAHSIAKEMYQQIREYRAQRQSGESDIFQTETLDERSA